MDKLELAEVYELEENLKASIVFAREYLKTTKLKTEQLQVTSFLDSVIILYSNPS